MDTVSGGFVEHIFDGCDVDIPLKDEIGLALVNVEKSRSFLRAACHGSNNPQISSLFVAIQTQNRAFRD